MAHKNIPPIYTQQVAYAEPVYQSGNYGEPSGHTQHGLHYNSMQTPVSIIDHQHYPPQGVFPTPPLQQQHSSHPDSPETYNEQDQYGQQNLADLLGELRMNEAGTGRQLKLPTTHNLTHL